MTEVSPFLKYILAIFVVVLMVGTVSALTLDGVQLFPTDNIFNTPIDAAPVDSNSAKWISTIRARSSVLDYNIRFNYNVVDDSVTHQYIGTFEYADESDDVPYPIPADPLIETEWSPGEGDYHMLIVDLDSQELYELYYAQKSGGVWNAVGGAVWDYTSNDMRPDGWTSSDAAGLPVLPLNIMYHEVENGVIPHALRLTIVDSDSSYVWPGSHMSGVSTNGLRPGMGVYFRLKSTYDISGFSPQSKTILQALKTYGMIVADNGAYNCLSMEPNDGWDMDDLQEIFDVDLNNFEAVDVSSLQVAMNSYQAVQEDGSPISAFSANATSGVTPLAVKFTDASNYAPTSWAWYWGTGETVSSTSQNPTATFTTGTYNVRLKTTNAYGSDWENKTGYITVSATPPPTGSGIIIDHTTINPMLIPDEWITAIKADSQGMDAAYTSHGYYIFSGLSAWEEYDSSLGVAFSGAGGLPSGDVMKIGNRIEYDWMQPTDGTGYYFKDDWSPSTKTKTYLNSGKFKYSFIEWCTELSDNGADYVDEYLAAMEAMEDLYPTITFIYTTGHADDSAQLISNNARIRAYCIANNKVLYDYGDIGSHNPSGTDYLNLGAGVGHVSGFGDECTYDGGNWCTVWKNANPTSVFTTVANLDPYEPHSTTGLQASMKGGAFWWLMARLEGWDGGASLPPAPVAAFSANNTYGFAPLNVGFADASTNSPTAWKWYWYANETVSSTSQNPTVALPAGIYNVRLNASNAYGKDWENKTNYIIANPTGVPPLVDFTAYGNWTGIAPLTVHFSGTATGAGDQIWNWSFGDGETANIREPYHTYVSAGTYDVSLNVSNPYGSTTLTKSGYIVVTSASGDPWSGYTPLSISGVSPLNITFTDISYNSPTAWNWSFRNVTGNNTEVWFSQAQNPHHIFYNGNYLIRLNASTNYGSNITPGLVYVNVSGVGYPPNCNFIANETLVNVGQPVQFTDTSTNSPTSWLWYFGEIVYTNTDQNPVNTYLTPGNYSPSLRCENSFGADSETKTNYIQVVTGGLDPVIVFTPGGTWNATSSRYELNIIRNQTLNFTYTGWYATTFNWSYKLYPGSLQTYYSNGQNLSVMYDNLNSTAYDIPLQVTLTGTNSYGSNSLTVYVIVRNVATPIPRFRVSSDVWFADAELGSTTQVDIRNGVTSGDMTTGYIILDDMSYNSPTIWNWTIDAGNGSTYHYTKYNSNPWWFQYMDADPGYYPVTLTAINAAGSTTLVATDIVHIVDTAPPPSISSITSTPGITSIIWKWLTPSWDTYTEDLDHIEVWKDGILYENITTWREPYFIFIDFVNVTLYYNTWYGNTTTWLGLAPNTSYTISTRTVDTSGNVNATWVNSTVSTSSGVWDWSTYGTYNWTCPADVTNISVILVGGGGSGKGGSNNGAGGVMRANYAGSGGEPGEIKTLSRYTVVPGQTYQIFVGRGGANASYGSASNPGTVTTAFSTNANPGDGGTALVATNGGAGQNGYGTDRLAINGTDGNVGVGGTAGLGRGASGGGGGLGTDEVAMGGMGADGLVKITVFGFQGGNIPDFVGNPTTSSPGTLVKFTDLSTIADPIGVTYNWSFGDYTYSDEAGDVSHVYAYLGSYDVALTISNPNGTFTETKDGYINIIVQSSRQVQYTAHLVRFRAVDYAGAPLDSMSVSAVVVESSSPYSWITEYLGVGLDETELAGTTQSGTTGSDGAIVFMMVESLKYRVDFTDTSESINESMYVYPLENNYEYTFWTETPVSSSGTISISLWNATNVTTPTYMDLGVRYFDSGSTTNNLSFYVEDDEGTVLLTRYSSTTNGWNTSYPVLVERGAAYVWTVSGNSTRFARPVSQSKQIRFGGSPPIPFDMGSTWNEYVALGIIFVIAFLFSRVNIKYGVAVVPLLTLFFYAIGYLSYTPIMIAVIVFFGIIFYIRYSEQESDV